jgi:hypothetical protein
MNVTSRVYTNSPAKTTAKNAVRDLVNDMYRDLMGFLRVQAAGGEDAYNARIKAWNQTLTGEEPWL